MSSPAVVPFTDDFRRAVLDAVFAQLQVSSEADRTARADQLQKEFGLQTATWGQRSTHMRTRGRSDVCANFVS